ncbi:unnamed protein product [[Candida] boidinii]|uniref:Unnamed protein product n=1 Tax=Candida boidinii TaxID=5477 RepID=A0A9W6SY45_CANBO|nr:hypothetical protein B5S30_g5789 [[Candida] boidinii]GME68650.1 unnamed protein product [[Candida] boidinii]
MSFNILLLLHPTVVTDESSVLKTKNDLLAKYGSNSKLTQQIISRLLDDSFDVSSLNNTYDLIFYLAPFEAKVNKFNSKLISIIFNLLKTNGEFTGLLPNDSNILAISNGFILNDNETKWIKPDLTSTSIISKLIKNSAPKDNNKKKLLPKFKKLSSSSSNTTKINAPSSSSFATITPALSPISTPLTSPSVSTPNLITDTFSSGSENEDSDSIEARLKETKLTYFDDSDDDEDEDQDMSGNRGSKRSNNNIDENDLIDDEFLNKPMVIPVQCKIDLASGSTKKRRKACKDCTCGLKEIEEEEERKQKSLQDTVLSKLVNSATEEAIKIEERIKRREESKLGSKIQFSEEDLTEVDFTIKGKTGGCNSCSLGDAFRCDSCPFLGLPAFKPGQIISLDTFGEDI